MSNTFLTFASFVHIWNEGEKKKLCLQRFTFILWRHDHILASQYSQQLTLTCFMVYCRNFKSAK